MGSDRAHPRSSPHRRALAEVVEAGPVPAVDGVVRWRRMLPLETVARRDHGRARVEGAGFAKISASASVEAFKKNAAGEDPGEAPDKAEIELWWQDGPHRHRRISSHADGPDVARARGRPATAHRMGLYLRTLEPSTAKGKGAGLVMPWCDTDAMAAHLIEIAPSIPAPMRC